MNNFIKISDQPSIGIASPKLISNRLDADYYQIPFVENEEVLQKSNIPIEMLGNMWIEANYGSLPDSVDYSEDGIYLIRGTDISGYGIAPENELIRVPASYYHKFKKAQVFPGYLLILVKGASIDRNDSNAIVPTNFAGKAIINGSIFKVKLKPEFDNYYVAAFMFSRHFLLQKRRSVTNTGALYNDLETIQNYQIAIPHPKIQAYIGDKARLAEKCKEEASQLLKQAKSDLISALGFNLYSMPSATNSSGSGYRLLQEKPGCILVENLLLGNSLLPTRYQSQYLERDRVLAEHVSEIQYLNEIATDFINGYDCREFQASGTPYIRVGNIHPSELNLDGVMYVQILPSQLPKKFQLNSGDLIITRKGSYGYCTSVTKTMEQMIFSSEIIRVPLHKEWDADYIALFLNSPYGRYQFDRLGTGTTMKGINHENLADVKVPKIPSESQKSIGRKVRLSMALIEMSKNLIAKACQDVENLIDSKIDIGGILTDEVQVPTWDEVYQNILDDRYYA